MRLHYHPTSPYSRKAAVAIRLRGDDDIELHVVDVTTGAHKQPAFLALSPFGKLPALERPGEAALFESTSIVEFLEARGPRRLLPEDPEARRHARHWDRLGDLYLLEPQGQLFFVHAPDVQAAARATAERALALVDAELADGRPFLGGDAFGLADLSPAIGATQLDALEIPLPDAVAAWMERCHDLPAMREERAAGRPLTEALLARRRAALGG
ncbi:MAG: glutathione S-transferase family protein [Myxococcota bacterium]